MTDSFFRLRFITSSDFVSIAIRNITGSEWSHTEIILPDGNYLGAHDDGGVQIRDPNYCSPTKEKRYSVPVSSESLNKILEFAHQQVGKSYDKTDILGILFHKNWDNPNAWICSELVAASAEAGGLFMLNVDIGYTHRITPEMLHLSPLLIGRCYYSAG